MMWRLLFLLNFITINLYAESRISAITESLAVAKFDLIVDEDVNNDDPRIKSIVYSAMSYKQSKIKIYYVNSNAKVLAVKLFQILTSWHLSVFKPEQTKSARLDDNKYIQIIINQE